MAFSWNPMKWLDRRQSSDNIVEQQNKNPNMGIFQNIDNDIDNAIARKSVLTQQDTSKFTVNPMFSAIANNITVLPMMTDKVERIKQYRSIALFPECDWCLDEIADDFIHEDENGDFIKLKLPDGKENINETRSDVLQNEFKKYIGLFRFKDDGFNLIKRFLIEGELAFENIISQDKPDRGIVAVKFIPTEYYNTLVDVRTGRSAGLYFDKEKFADDLKYVLSQSYLGAQQIFNSMLVSTTPMYNAENCVPMLWPQLTYMSSGEYSPDGLICYSMLEKAKQAYHQLSLMQDAAVILRVTRAPERLLFNVSTGRMNQNYADAYVRQFANELKSKKVVGKPGVNGQPDVASVYNPVSMLESYVFGRSDANDGTSVESVGSSANYEEIADIEFFLRKLMKSFKVPFSRYKTPENVAEKDESISYEEYAFSRLIIRLQRRFALGFRKGYITHLKLRGIWDNYNLRDSDIDISFNPPVLYDIYENQKFVSAKMDTYKAIVDNEEFSKILAMKKILGMRQSEIDENFRMLTLEKQLVALSDKLSENIGDEVDPTSPYAQSPIPTKKEEESDSGDEGGGDSSSDDSDSDDSESEPEKGSEAETPTFGLS